MAKMTPTTHGHFRTIKFAVINTSIDLSQKELEARNAGRDEEADTYYETRGELDKVTHVIGRAQRAVLLSDENVDALVKSLGGVADDMKKGRKQMESLNSFLKGATEIVNLLIGLAKLVA